MNTQDLIKTNLICKLQAGSHAYGTSLPTSDVDFRGLFFAPQESIRTPFLELMEISDASEEDTKFYELNKFMKLFTLANPNIIELMFVDRESIILTSDPYEYLREHTPALLSSKVAFTFSGYAVAQLKRLQGHKRWIMNPQPEESPTQNQYCSLVQNYEPEKSLKGKQLLMEYAEGHVFIHYGGDIYGVYHGDKSDTLFNADGSIRMIDSERAIKIRHTSADGAPNIPRAIFKFNRTEYQGDRNNWSNFWNWRKNRNEARAALEAKNGYDTKAAMHLVRLMNMCVEILSTGDVLVKRPDAELLLDVRAGKWSYEEIIEFATAKDALIRNELYKNTSLPKTPNLTDAMKITMDVQDMCWNGAINLRAGGA